MTRTRHLTAGRDRETVVISVVVAVPCGLACAGSVLPGLDDAVTAVLLGVAVLALAVLPLRWTLRWARERREDTADAHTAALWRVAHAPHLLTSADRERLGISLPVGQRDAAAVPERAARALVGLIRGGGA